MNKLTQPIMNILLQMTVTTITRMKKTGTKVKIKKCNEELNFQHKIFWNNSFTGT